MDQLFDTQVDPDIAGFAHVALEQGIDAGGGTLTYAIPKALDDLAVGSRVIVPLGRGNKPTPGYIVERVAHSDYDPAKVKRIVSRDAHGVSLTEDLIRLAQWMAGYYCCPLGMVFATMLPAAVKRGTGTVQQKVVSLSPAAAAGDPEGVRLTKLQRKVLETSRCLARDGEPWVEVKRLADLAGARSVIPINHLIDKDVLTVAQATAVHARQSDDVSDIAAQPVKLALMTSQQTALDRLAATVHDGFTVHLLHGVTGSGKTEVYLRMIEHVQEEHPGAGAIVLVPEIALTPQTVGRFIGRFAKVAVLHSGLTAAQRHEQWRRIRSGEARIVVGARSAIFAPMDNLGVIIVDEEHENSYKQDQLPRYHARDVAVRRGQLRNIPVVLGSATPSLESWHNATRRKAYHLIQLPDRVMNLKLPRVEVVDMIAERKQRRGIHLLSQRLEVAMHGALDSGAKVMLLLNRRGYANYIACPDQRCGWMMTCDYCDTTMVYHKDKSLPAGGNVRCHHCNAEQLLPPQCPECGRKVSVFGLGTQRVESEVHQKFYGIGYLRMDSDVMRTGRDYQQSLDRFRRGEVRILIGTQMIAKGLDFPDVGLVGVISADTSIHMPDFRASERTFTLIAQVAGRAGRSERKGLVIVQTFNPDDAAIGFAKKHDYEGFAAHELKLREQVGLPPLSRMARIVVRDLDLAACFEQAQTLAGHLRRFNQQQGEAVRIRGPAPCPIARIAEYHRQQIELLAPPPHAAVKLQKLLTALRNEKLLISDAKMAVDVDPVDLL